MPRDTKGRFKRKSRPVPRVWRAVMLIAIVMNLILTAYAMSFAPANGGHHAEAYTINKAEESAHADRGVADAPHLSGQPVR